MLGSVAGTWQQFLAFSVCVQALPQKWDDVKQASKDITACYRDPNSSSRVALLSWSSLTVVRWAGAVSGPYGIGRGHVYRDEQVPGCRNLRVTKDPGWLGQLGNSKAWSEPSLVRSALPKGTKLT
jgi:hypothetical protein